MSFVENGREGTPRDFWLLRFTWDLLIFGMPLLTHPMRTYCGFRQAQGLGYSQEQHQKIFIAGSIGAEKGNSQRKNWASGVRTSAWYSERSAHNPLHFSNIGHVGVHPAGAQGFLCRSSKAAAPAMSRRKVPITTKNEMDQIGHLCVLYIYLYL